MERTYSLTVNNITATQFAAITKLLDTPEPTVSPDESEDFGTTALTADDVQPTKKAKTRKAKAEVVEEETEEETEESDENFDEEGESGVTTELTFSEIKRVINAYGNQFPELMRGIITRAGAKNTKDLESKPNLWKEIYVDVCDRLKRFEKTQRAKKRSE